MTTESNIYRKEMIPIIIAILTPELKQVIKSLDVSFASKDKVKIPSGYRNVTLISVANSILFNSSG